jgi:hypothetical protein
MDKYGNSLYAEDGHFSNHHVLVFEMKIMQGYALPLHMNLYIRLTDFRYHGCVIYAAVNTCTTQTTTAGNFPARYILQKVGTNRRDIEMERLNKIY